MSRHRTIRVASVPAAHPYVRHLGPVPTSVLATVPDHVELGAPRDQPEVVRLADLTTPWWPPTMLDPEWVRANASAFDLMHVHFGFDSVSPEELDRLGEALNRARRPLVVTVHDLRNPHHPSPELHDRQLGVLLHYATKVVTLTAHAAGQIRAKHGLDAEVIPHPHIVELDEMRRHQTTASRRTAGAVVGIHLKSMRPNMEAAVVDAAVRAVAEVPRSQLRVDVHLDVAEASGLRHDPALMAKLHRYERQGALRLHQHDFFTDDAFFAYVASLTISVLPYRFGTHSGWLEACRDLGVAVVAPDCGSYHDQGPVFRFGCNEQNGLDAQSCFHAITDALRRQPPPPVHWRERIEQRTAIAEAHLRLYQQALDATRTSTGVLGSAILRDRRLAIEPSGDRTGP